MTDKEFKACIYGEQKGLGLRFFNMGYLVYWQLALIKKRESA